MGSPRADIILTAGSGSYTVKKTGVLDILLYGPGGNGGSSPGTAASGGGGGGAARKRLKLRKGQVISYTVGTPGSGATTASLAGVFSFSANPGSTGGIGFVAGGAGGTGVGGDVNPGTDDGDVITAQDGEYGGRHYDSGSGAGSGGGGGGGAGFTEVLANLKGDGRGNTGGSPNLPTQPGGGGKGGVTGTPGDTGATGAVAFIYAK